MPARVAVGSWVHPRQADRRKAVNASPPPLKDALPICRSAFQGAVTAAGASTAVASPPLGCRREQRTNVFAQLRVSPRSAHQAWRLRNEGCRRELAHGNAPFCRKHERLGGIGRLDDEMARTKIMLALGPISAGDASGRMALAQGHRYADLAEVRGLSRFRSGIAPG